ncbi:chitinase [Streptomyces sp. NPDC050560]|uniref:chitinase n=1 Tax=Streptomyces sp. NPDC050560 TaxID=3365630 RepID=UPI00379737F0
MSSRYRRRYGRRGAAALVALAALATACGGHGATADGDGQGAERARVAGGFAPFVDTTLTPPFDLESAGEQTGVKHYTLAFVTAEDDGGHGEKSGADGPDGGDGPDGSDGGDGAASCHPTWGGEDGLTTNAVARAVRGFRDAGGDVRVSFGGQSGTELAIPCRTTAALTDAYTRVLDALHTRRADFDVEQGALTDTASVTRRNEALAALQKQRPGLEVSYTLPVMPEGLTAPGAALLRDAARHGVKVARVNIMAMDYGPDYRGDMGRYAERAATAAHGQIAAALGLDATAAWHTLAVTPMIGANDVSGEVFTPADATHLAGFAADRGIGELSLWSAARDRPCPDGTSGHAHPDCSSVDQRPGDFQRALGAAH